jgi:hypothetical protein
MFFISKPDFELQNFSIDELIEIAFQLAEKKGLKLSILGKLKKETKKAKSANEFFKILHKQSPIFRSVSKGAEWGKALVKYARWNLLGKEFGDKDDRLINQIIRIIYNGFYAQYVYCFFIWVYFKMQKINIKKVLETYKKSLVTKIDLPSLYSRSKIAHKWKLTYGRLSKEK